jgi:hypothetical protein
MRISVPKNYDEILESLFLRYYKKEQDFSLVTSSHWKIVGSHNVRRCKNGYELTGVGFGNFIPISVQNRLRYFPENYLSNKLLKQFHVSKPLKTAAKLVAKKTGRLFEFDCAKQAIALEQISRTLNIPFSPLSANVSNRIKMVCVIGDGYGYFASLLMAIDPNIHVICVNLGRTLFFDAAFCSKVYPEKVPGFITGNTKNPVTLCRDLEICFLEAENYHVLSGLPIDLFINIASMQEMEPKVIFKYFEFMRQSSSKNVVLYCCNRDEKTLPDGTIVRFSDYPWNNCKILLDELCPWYERYPASLPPFWRKFDSTFRHRLVELK